jgi:hypothetical protein
MLGLLGSSATAADGDSSTKLSDAVERTRSTTATYSLYVQTRITPPSRDPINEWAAEFHRGNLHRVETPRDRVVADCARLTGSHLNLMTGVITRGSSEAKSACGINANPDLVSGKWLGVEQSRFGPVDRLELTDSEHVRGYDVASNGALVASTIADLDGTMRLRTWATALLPTLPEQDIFSEASLARQVASDAMISNETIQDQSEVAAN